MTNRSQLLTALQKINDAHKVVSVRKEEDSLMKRLITALEAMGSVTSFMGPKGDKGDRGIPGYTPKKGIDYFDGKNGENGKDGRDGKNGIDGKEGPPGKDASVSEMLSIASDESEMAINAHQSKHDHTLIHDPKMLGTLEADLSTLTEGKIFQVKNGKIVGIDLPKPQQIPARFHASQGVSNVRSFTVTASRELDAMGIYVVDATAGNITITVPSASGRENHWFEVIRIDATANTVTVVPTGSETLSGETSYLLQQWTDLRIFSHNGSYLIRSAG